ncbi:MAG: hypothetical protein A2007_02970 [Verrucomicrobia bacterium GWC2_42_7]|nr:MAG: hypothetical protein A2007_02970 [Verrucomicrobia bacterium GWC2_42_7]
MNSVPAVKVDHLTKHYGAVAAIDGVSFTIQAGEVVGFLGPNGAGKSTTMRILAGIMPATSGRAFVCGTSVARSPDVTKRYIGYMPENNPLPDDMRICEYLHFRAKIKEVPSKYIKTKVQEVMELCDLHHRTQKRIIGTLSKGYRQRVGIADTLLNDPKVVIMDEPTIGLDPHQVIAIRRLINNLKGRTTIIFSSHILPEVEASCSQVIIINQGRIVAQGSPQVLQEKFLPFTRFRVVTHLQDMEKVKDLLSKNIPEIQLCLNPQGEAWGEVILETEDKQFPAERIFEVLRVDESIKVLEISKHIPTLENVFLSATKKSWKEKTDLFIRANTLNLQRNTKKST